MFTQSRQSRRAALHIQSPGAPLAGHKHPIRAAGKRFPTPVTGFKYNGWVAGNKHFIPVAGNHCCA